MTRLLAVTAIGLLVAPLVLWILAPSLPAHLESDEEFYWAGAESGTGHPLLLRVQNDGHQIVAGSDRYGLSEDMPCYDGDVAPSSMQRGLVAASRTCRSTPASSGA